MSQSPHSVFEPLDAKGGVVVAPAERDGEFHQDRKHAGQPVGGVRRPRLLIYDLAGVARSHAGRVMVAIDFAESL